MVVLVHLLVNAGVFVSKLSGEERTCVRHCRGVCCSHILARAHNVMSLPGLRCDIHLKQWPQAAEPQEKAELLFLIMA